MSEFSNRYNNAWRAEEKGTSGIGCGGRNRSSSSSSSSSSSKRQQRQGDGGCDVDGRKNYIDLNRVLRFKIKMSRWKGWLLQNAASIS
jgi:hypothetical protein